MDTETIILDEPTAGQDSLAIKRLGSIIDSLVQEGKPLLPLHMIWNLSLKILTESS